MLAPIVVARGQPGEGLGSGARDQGALHDLVADRDLRRQGEAGDHGEDEHLPGSGSPRAAAGRWRTMRPPSRTSERRGGPNIPGRAP